jgi:ADP-dependent NAD(P)H-hydrate dehydratase / NAD(P)H-hydrate epimerase
VAARLRRYCQRTMIELLTTAEMAEADRLAIAAGASGIDLMENAGRAVADLVAARHGTAVPVTAVAGLGNNGGDGFVAARILRERGYSVRVLLAGDAGRLKGDAAMAAGRWGVPLEAASPAGVAATGVLIDALLGAGLDRPVAGAARTLIETINAAPAKIYAVDLPSGIDGTSGAVQGAAVKASETITFFRRKVGHLLLPGRLHCGKVHLADIGIGADVLGHVKPQAFHNVPELWGASLPIPRLDGHKYSRGHAVVVSGGISSTGAARLAARGALRAGAGLVTIASPRAALAVNAAASLAVMVRPVDGDVELTAFMSDRRRNVVVLGPGGGVGPEMRDMVLAALAVDCAVVLDADALISFCEDPNGLLAALKGHPEGATVLTPHAGEFSRLFQALPNISRADSKLQQARQAAALTGAIVLLKGPDTVVAAPDGRAVIADNAPPWLASAGSGDVLAGLVAGLLAQGMPCFEAAAAAVWLHGEAGSTVGPGLIAEDLPEALPKLYRRLFAEHSR